MSFDIHSRVPSGHVRKLKALTERHADINWALGDQAVISGASFVTTVLLARFLGLEEFGRFTLAWLGVFLAQNLQLAMIATPLLTIAAKQTRADWPVYKGAILVQQAIFAAVMTAIVYAGARTTGWFVPEWGLDGLALPLAALVFCAQWADFMRRYHYAFERANVSFAVDFLRYGVQLGLLVAFFLHYGPRADVAGVLLCMAAAALLATLPGIAFVGQIKFTLHKFNQVARRHWPFSRWLILTAFAQWARDNFVFTAVGAYLGLAEVGALRAAQQLVTAVNVPLQGFDNIVPARASAAYASGGFTGLAGFIGRFVARYMGAVAAVLVLIALSGNWLLASVFGQAYGAYGFLVAGLAFVMLIYLVRNVVTIMLRAMEITVFEFYSALAGAAVIMASSYPLVESWGLAGAVASLALFDGVVLAVLLIGLRRARGLAATTKESVGQ